MIIGVPKESWRDEHRVALTPAGINTLVKAGHKVIVQMGAGLVCGFTNEAYDEAGATLGFGASEVFGNAQLIVTVMPPTWQEVEWLTAGKMLFSFINFGVVNPKIMAALCEAKCTAIGYNLMEDDAGNLPVLTAMSEIVGMLLPQIAGQFLATPKGGRGIALGGAAGIPAAHVVIIGAGIVGSTAAEAFAGAGADVTVMDSDLSRLRQLEKQLHNKVNTVMATPYSIDRYMENTDVLVGAVQIHGRQSPHIVTETQVKRMRKGSVILDVAIDQGGCIETSRPTSHSDPVFIHHGVIHYAVPNIPALVARTASHALNNVILPFLRLVAERGESAFATNALLRHGAYLYNGQCTHAEMGKLLGWPAVPMEELVAPIHNGAAEQ